MNTRKSFTKMSIDRNCFYAVVALTLCAPAFAHDPLREEDGHVHDERHDQHVIESHGENGGRVGLEDVRSLVTEFRETGDDYHLDQAWALLKPAIENGTGDSETLIVAAFVAQSRHDFDQAEALVDTSLAINPNNDEAWLLLASIRLVRGDAVTAKSACGKLRRAEPLVILTCNARTALAKGNQSNALNRLQRVLDILDSQRTPTETLAWSFSVAGDLAVATGQSQLARKLYRQSLNLAERTQVRSALVDVLLTESDYVGAWEALDAGAPALPLLVRRLIAAKELGRLHEVEAELAKVEQEFEHWISREDWLHAREMARFYIDVVDRPKLARRLAVINIELQKEPEDIRLERLTRS